MNPRPELRFGKDEQIGVEAIRGLPLIEGTDTGGEDHGLGHPIGEIAAIEEVRLQIEHPILTSVGTGDHKTRERPPTFHLARTCLVGTGIKHWDGIISIFRII